MSAGSEGPAPESAPVDVNEIMREIRERVRRKRAAALPPDPREDQFALVSTHSEWSRLRFSSAELREAMRQFGDPPPQPPTLRGRIGMVFALLVRRAVFWQTEQMRRFQAAAVTAFDEQTRAVEALAVRSSALAGRLETLEGEAANLRAAVAQDRRRLEALLESEAGERRDLASSTRASLRDLEHARLRQTATEAKLEALSLEIGRLKAGSRLP